MRRRPLSGRDSSTPALPFVALSDLLMTVLALITIYFLVLYAVTQQKLNTAHHDLQVAQEKLEGKSRRTDLIRDYRVQVAKRVVQDLPSLKVRQEESDQQTFTFEGDVLFNTSSYNIDDKPQARTQLELFAKSLSIAIKEALKADKNRVYPEIQIHGHTDGVKDVTIDNWHLSALRALAVVDVLRQSGRLPTEQMSAAGYSCHRPVVRVNGDNAANRRIEIRLLYSLKTDEKKDSVPPFPCNCD